MQSCWIGWTSGAHAASVRSRRPRPRPHAHRSCGCQLRHAKMVLACTTDRSPIVFGRHGSAFEVELGPPPVNSHCEKVECLASRSGRAAVTLSCLCLLMQHVLKGSEGLTPTGRV